MADHLTSDTGPFAIVPVWVIESPLSDRAVRLYAYLARKADNETGQCWPSRPTMAKVLGCSVDTLDRAVAELVSAGAVTKGERRDAKGEQTSNLYTVRRLDPQGGRTHAAGGVAAPTRGGSRTDAALSRPSELDQEPAAAAASSPRRRSDPRADAVTTAWWLTRDPRPLQPFVAVRGIVDKALKAGHTEDAVLAALTEIGGDPPIVGWKLDKALQRQRRSGAARGGLDDR